MESGLQNLVPAIVTINQARGTYSFGEIEKDIDDFMGCPLIISKVEKKLNLEGQMREYRW